MIRKQRFGTSAEQERKRQLFHLVYEICEDRHRVLIRPVHVVYKQNGIVGCYESQQANEGLSQDGGRVGHRCQHIGIGGPTWQDTSQRWPYTGEPRVVGKRCSRTGEGVHERSIGAPRFDRTCSENDNPATLCLSSGLGEEPSFAYSGLARDKHSCALPDHGSVDRVDQDS
jgi:hypothetical protein